MTDRWKTFQELYEEQVRSGWQRIRFQGDTEQFKREWMNEFRRGTEGAFFNIGSQPGFRPGAQRLVQGRDWVYLWCHGRRTVAFINRPICAKCGRLVEKLDVIPPQHRDVTQYRAQCHGMVESIEVSGIERSMFKTVHYGIAFQS